MKIFFNEGNQIHNFISSSGSDFLTNYGPGSTSQKVTVPVPQHCVQALVEAVKVLVEAVIVLPRL